MTNYRTPATVKSPAPTDPELLARIRTGDRKAFEMVYERYWQKLYRAAQNVVRDQEQSMDILQEVFVSLWVKRETIQIDNLQGYLYGTVRYQISHLIRHRKVRESFFDEVKALSLKIENHDVYDATELEAIVEKNVKALPKRCREIFILSRYEHLSYKEIAAKLGITEKTVDAQLQIAFKRLRVAVGDFITILVLLLLS